MIWLRSSSSHFSVKSLYSRLIKGSLTNNFRDVWRSWIPLEIKIFMWQAMCGRLPAADQIRKENGQASNFYALCASHEASDYAIFKCDLAALFWRWIGSWLYVTWAPNSFSELRPLAMSLPCQNRNFLREINNFSVISFREIYFVYYRNLF